MTDTDYIEREVEANRASVESTLEKLKGRISVEQIVNDVGHFIGLDNARGTLQTAGRQVRENPLALGLIGVGLAWLVLGNGDRSSRNQSYTPYSGNASDWDTPSWGGPQRDREGSGALHNAAEAVRDATGKVVSGARHAMANVKDYAGDAASKVSDMTEVAQDRMHSTVESTMHTVRGMQSGIADRIERQPLIVGAIAVAVGAVIGAALPRTQTENRLMGDQRDQMLQTAKAATRDLRGKVGEAAQHSYQAAVDAAKDEGLLPEGDKSIAAKIGAVAGAALNTATSEVETAVRGTAADVDQTLNRNPGTDI